MPNNTTAKKTVRKRVKYFEILLNLTFEQHHGSANDIEKEDEGWRAETNEEFCAKIADWNKTDEKFGTKDGIMKHVKSNDPMGFVEYLATLNGEVLSAKWLDGFAISFVFKCTDSDILKASREEGEKMIEEDLRGNSLEDGEYESSGDNGWTVKTLGETMEYGLTDYRQNPIRVVEISAPRKPRVKKTNTQTRRRR